MDRRTFLISTGSGAAAAAALSVSGPAAADQAVSAPQIATRRQTLSCSMPWADNGRGFGDSARRLALRVQEATDGRISLVFGAEAQAADAVHGSTYAAGVQGDEGEMRALAYFAGLPGAAGLPIHDHLAWLTAGGGQMLWDDLAAGAGVKPLAVGHTGGRGLLWSMAPVETLSGLQGKKIAIMGAGGDVARGLGLEPVAASASADADLVDIGGALSSLAANVHMSHKAALDGGLAGGGTLLSLSIKLEVWDGLHPGDKMRIAHAAEAELQGSIAEARAHDQLVRGVLASSFGVRILPMPGEILAARNRVAEAVIAHIAAAGPKAQRIDQSFMAFRAMLAEGVA